MSVPFVKSGKLHVGKDFVCGNNVTIDVDEEVIIGDRCVLPDNTYLGGRQIEIGDDFYGFSWEWRRLDVGRGRRDVEQAILRIGDRCTLHDNFIDLSREVTLGNDVGLSPQVVIYTHGYWQSVLEGYPARYASAGVGSNSIVGFRSILVPGSYVGPGSVIGAQSVVCDKLQGNAVYGGNPAQVLRKLKKTKIKNLVEREETLKQILSEYADTLVWRGLEYNKIGVDYPVISYRGITIDVETFECVGEEDESTDDLRDFLFRHGIRVYTQRLFKRLPKGGK